MRMVLFKDHVLINNKLFYYRESDSEIVCSLCYFKCGLSCCKKYREYVGIPYTKSLNCYALEIEIYNKGKISNRIPMITILKPFPYELSLFIYMLITRNESKFKIYEI